MEILDDVYLDILYFIKEHPLEYNAGEIILKYEDALKNAKLPPNAVRYLMKEKKYIDTDNVRTENTIEVRIRLSNTGSTYLANLRNEITQNNKKDLHWRITIIITIAIATIGWIIAIVK